MSFAVTGSMGEEHLSVLSHKKIAAIGGVWMFRSETDHRVVTEEEIVRRLKHSLSLAKRFKEA